MRGFAPLIFFLVITGKNNAQKPVELKSLIEITATRDFSSLTRLTRELAYIVADSLKESNGSLIYITRELKISGNTLGCIADGKLKVEQLHFSTYSKDIYIDFKRQIKTMGFTSSGLRTQVSDAKESEDFENNKIYISTAAGKKGNGKIEYEFTFLKW